MGGLGKRRQIAGWKPNFLVFANHASGGLEIPRRYYSYQWSAWKRLGRSKEFFLLLDIVFLPTRLNIL
jgi:hypothetical protein